MGNLKNIFKTVFLFICLLFCNQNTEALQVVYPKAPDVEINANSTFFIGSTAPGSSLCINDKEVQVFENGSFVEVVDLNDGVNTIKIESKNDTEQETLTYTIKKNPQTISQNNEPELIEFPENEYLYAVIAKENTPLRTEPNENAQRISHPTKDTVLMINGKKGEFYRVSLTPEENAWVRADKIVSYQTLNTKMYSHIKSIAITEDKNFEYIKTKLSFPVPFKIIETDKGLTLDLYNVKNDLTTEEMLKSTASLQSLVMNNVEAENKSTYYLELKEKLWGYDVYYDDEALIFKIRKTPQLNTTNPFKGLVIAIDAGHGGDDAGAIGPTGVKEKEINLDIAKRLEKLLENNGTKVIMTRDEDSQVDLYKRVKIAKKSNALILLSIHANALADGANPYEKHGTSTFYYHKQALSLANVIKDVLIEELQTKDDGTSKCSFVLTRPTMPLSVLVEVAYMIHPQEYTLLLDETFRQKAAEALQKALLKYITNEYSKTENNN